MLTGLCGPALRPVLTMLMLRPTLTQAGSWRESDKERFKATMLAGRWGHCLGVVAGAQRGVKASRLAQQRTGQFLERCRAGGHPPKTVVLTAPPPQPEPESSTAPEDVPGYYDDVEIDWHW